MRCPPVLFVILSIKPQGKQMSTPCSTEQVSLAGLIGSIAFDTVTRSCQHGTLLDARPYLSWIEGLTTNQDVAGSNPAGRATSVETHNNLIVVLLDRFSKARSSAGRATSVETHNNLIVVLLDRFSKARSSAGRATSAVTHNNLIVVLLDRFSKARSSAGRAISAVTHNNLIVVLLDRFSKARSSAGRAKTPQVKRIMVWSSVTA